MRAVLFDLDGVVVDSYEAWFQTVRATAKGFGFPDVTREQFEKTWGQGVSADIRALYPGRTRAEVEAVYERELGAQTSTIRINAEARATLVELGERRILRALVTNTQVGLAKAILEAARLGDLFDDVQGVRAGIREKPEPDLLLAALHALGVGPADALMVGDSRFDEEGAAAAKVPFLRYDMRSGASLRAAVMERIPAV